MTKLIVAFRNFANAPKTSYITLGMDLICLNLHRAWFLMRPN